jgi:23S rRNA-intervening sequence protein
MNTSPSKGVELEKRFIAFAAEILKISAKLPKSLQGRHISRQLLRSGTSTAANYGEARGAESRSDFVHKLGVVAEGIERNSDLARIDCQNCACSSRRDRTRYR